MKMWAAGSSASSFTRRLVALAGTKHLPGIKQREAGFTLFELLVVMTLLALVAGSVSLLYREPSLSAGLRADGLKIASRIRDLRAAALSTQSEQLLRVDISRKVVSFSAGLKPVEINPVFNVRVVGAQSEKLSSTISGIRYYPNGGSSGGTITLEPSKKAGRESDKIGFEIRINWLSGRVSARQYGVGTD